MIKNKKILITGIYGFLGTHLSHRLEAENEIIGINQSRQEKNLQISNFCGKENMIFREKSIKKNKFL